MTELPSVTDTTERIMYPVMSSRTADNLNCEAARFREQTRKDLAAILKALPDAERTELLAPFHVASDWTPTEIASLRAQASQACERAGRAERELSAAVAERNLAIEDFASARETIRKLEAELAESAADARLCRDALEAEQAYPMKTLSVAARDGWRRGAEAQRKRAGTENARTAPLVPYEPPSPAPRSDTSADPTPPIRWQCSGCKFGFPNPWLKTCPHCGRDDYWSGSVNPNARRWRPGVACSCGRRSGEPHADSCKVVENESRRAFRAEVAAAEARPAPLTDRERAIVAAAEELLRVHSSGPAWFDAVKLVIDAAAIDLPKPAAGEWLDVEGMAAATAAEYAPDKVQTGTPK